MSKNQKQNIHNTHVFHCNQFSKNQPTHNIIILPLSLLPIIIVQEQALSAEPGKVAKLVKTDKTAEEQREYNEKVKALHTKYRRAANSKKDFSEGDSISSDEEEQSRHKVTGIIYIYIYVHTFTKQNSPIKN